MLMTWKNRSVSHEEKARFQPNGSPGWGNPCEVRGCKNDNAPFGECVFWVGHEVCKEHADKISHILTKFQLAEAGKA